MTQTLSRVANVTSDFLSGPELAGLTLIARGMRTADAASEVGMDVDQFDAMLRGCQAKLGAVNRINAVAIAMRLGLIGIEAWGLPSQGRFRSGCCRCLSTLPCGSPPGPMVS